jgi:hypothetical protein
MRPSYREPFVPTLSFFGPFGLCFSFSSFFFAAHSLSPLSCPSSSQSPLQTHSLTQLSSTSVRFVFRLSSAHSFSLLLSGCFALVWSASLAHNRVKSAFSQQGPRSHDSIDDHQVMTILNMNFFIFCKRALIYLT